MPALEFIDKLVKLIPDKNFRLIRYYGAYSRKTRKKLHNAIAALTRVIPPLPIGEPESVMNRLQEPCLEQGEVYGGRLRKEAQDTKARFHKQHATQGDGSDTAKRRLRSHGTDVNRLEKRIFRADNVEWNNTIKPHLSLNIEPSKHPSKPSRGNFHWKKQKNRNKRTPSEKQWEITTEQ
jgi:hypothetical protein